MTEKRFYLPALLAGLTGLVLAVLMRGEFAVLAGGIGVLLSMLKRKSHHVKLAAVLSAIALLAGIAAILWVKENGGPGLIVF